MLPTTERPKKTNNVVTSNTALAVVVAVQCISASGLREDHVTLFTVDATSDPHSDDVIAIA